MRRILSVFVVLTSMFVVYAMDGVCIASIQGAPSYKYWMTTGTMVKYEIKSNFVVKVDTLSGGGCYASPRINMSGTYYAALRGIYNATNQVVFRPLYGNPSSEAIVTLADSATWFWWLNDGSILYLTPAWARRDFRKVTLSRAGGKLVVTDRLWAKLTYDIQGGFVGVDGHGGRTLSMDGLDVHASLMNGDTTINPTPAYPGGIGCGYAISPSGTYFCQWPGTHNVWGWSRWDGQPMTGGSGGQSLKSFVDSGWVMVGPNDPEGKLEVFTNNAWLKDPIGLMGADNNWSQNSENWYMSEVGAGIQDGGDGDCFNAIAVNWRDRIALNVTKIMPVNETMSTRSKFRGITFTGGTQFSADRPTLWCSSKADVWDSLWQYIESRQADNQKWSDLLGLPLSEIPASHAARMGLTSAQSASVLVGSTNSGVSVLLPRSGNFEATVFDLAGRTVMLFSGREHQFNLPMHETGSYFLRVIQGGDIMAANFVIP